MRTEAHASGGSGNPPPLDLALGRGVPNYKPIMLTAKTKKSLNIEDLTLTDAPPPPPPEVKFPLLPYSLLDRAYQLDPSRIRAGYIIIGSV